MKDENTHYRKQSEAPTGTVICTSTEEQPDAVEGETVLWSGSLRDLADQQSSIRGVRRHRVRSGDLEMITTSRAARLIGISTSSLRNLRSKGEGPRGYVRLSRCSGAYPLHEVRAYMESRRGKVRKHESPFGSRS
jgi:hypothetical protein